MASIASRSISRKLTVHTNDPLAPRVILTVNANVLTSIVVLPGDRVKMSNLREGMSSSTLLIRKEPNETGVLEVRNLETSAPWLLARVRKLEAVRPATDRVPEGQPGDWLLEVEISAQPESIVPGVQKEEIRFDTGLELQPTVTLPVAVYYRPPPNPSE